MWKRALSSIVLASAAALPAQAQDWDFSYTGFHWLEADLFNPTLTETGHFSGSDANGNGVLELGELSQFSWSSVSYLGGGGCGSGITCTLEQFSYTNTGQLNFRTSWYSVGGDNSSQAGTIAWDRSWFISSGSWGSATTTYLWTPETRFAISPQPVPEPSGGLMLLLGVAGLAGWRRLRSSLK
ncbi:PEP-CTERM sorting domain-containing protein [Massilia endophytica]|uniref:PEP-CTERM sorting domain-containing protein n=1 Tax=Massilia endophytica TaxID=2899220 RepID=UPI001E54B124|nr:PEP-CTERM sorting domain-containing protein [Massilia endophytica]UGQ48723.1 PEP-CTERM sorting domain-containing protein [Massilia endophytica]